MNSPGPAISDENVAARLETGYRNIPAHITARLREGVLARINDAVLCAVLASVLAFLWFFPVAFSHLSGADRYLAHVSVIPAFDHTSIWHVYRDLAERYRAQHPGWFPLAPLPLFLWLLPPIPVKIVQLALVAGTFATFGAFAYRCLKSRSAALLAVVFALCCWQYRTPHDPVIGTSLVTPWCCGFALLAWLGWMNYELRKRALWLATTCAAGVLAVFCGVIPGALALALALAAVLRNKKSFASWGLAGVVIASASLSLTLGTPAVPWHHAGSYAANSLTEAIAAIPASYRALGGAPKSHVASLWHGMRYVDDRFTTIPAITGLGWLCVLLGAALAYFSLSREVFRKRDSIALVFGICFWLVPSLLLGSPDVWRAGLTPGQAFPGVYFEYFGVAMLAAYSVLRLAERRGSFPRLLPSTAALAVLCLCYGNIRMDNLAFARSIKQDDALSLIERAGGAGFFSALPEGSTIAIDPALHLTGAPGVSDAKYALYQYSGKRFNVISAQDIRAGHGAVWLLDTSRDTGIFVSLSHAVKRSGRGEYLVDRAYGYTVFPSVWKAVEGAHIGFDGSSSLLRDGRLLNVRRDCGPVPVSAAFTQQKPTVEWGRGFFPSGPVGYHLSRIKGQSTEWGGGYYSADQKMFMAAEGALTIIPAQCPHGAITVTLTALASAPSMLWMRSPRGVEHVDLWFKPTTFSLHYRNVRSPIHVRLSTDAPEANLDPIIFRYERDTPRHLHVTFTYAQALQELPRSKAVR